MQVNIPYVDPSGNGLVNVVTVVITMVTYWTWNHPNLELMKFDAWNYVENESRLMVMEPSHGVPSRSLTAKALKSYQNLIGKDRLPTIFQWLC